MAAQADTSGRPALAGQRWYACSPDAVAAALEVAPGTGLSSQQAAELLRANGPSALPEEKPGWRRLLDQYRSYLQLILVGAAVVSLLIREWSTGVLPLVLTLPGQIRPGRPP
jgi:Ca2+-transporting ATPase